MNEPKSRNFEESLEKLRNAAALVQSGNCTLDEMTAAYKEGIKAARECLAMLDRTDKELLRLSDETEKMLKEGIHHDSGIDAEKEESD
ncbi:exodeoxyribonuclease VII small subunit [uncultured Dialister sp.]|uniref:exodeoxyribonuclease VII small subunit n=1 Tax=uncultured Dialister sp. TaxID=278064 RepID=UPI0025EA4E0C|nr:exodeoxyribonuclease VII small subunit [uncultured Dialister sp.]